MVDRDFIKINGRTITAGVKPYDDRKMLAALEGVSREIGGFRQYVLPEEVLGRDSMLAFRGINPGEIRSENDILTIIKDNVVLRLNDLDNSIPLDVRENPKYPNPHEFPKVERVQDAMIYTLLQLGFVDGAIAYLTHRSSHGLARTAARGGLEEIAKDQMLFEGFPSRNFRDDMTRLYESHGVDNVDSINQLLEEDGAEGFKTLISDFEKLYNRKLEQAYGIYQQKNQDGKIRAIIISGKSSSGKTTTMHKFCEEIVAQREGVNLVPLSIDNYFAEDRPKDPRGYEIYELPEQLDLNQLRVDLEKILAGERVVPPIFNFKEKRSYPESGKPIQLRENDVLVIDSHMGLYPAIRELISPEERFIIYLQPFNMIKYGDGSSGRFIELGHSSMLRRWARDLKKRNTSLIESAHLWKYAELGMARDIVPRMTLSDIIIPSGFPYEFNFMRTFYDENPLPDPRFFVQAPQGDELPDGRKGGQLYAAVRSWQAQELLSQFNPVPKQWIEGYDVLPANSILREFVGGSSYEKKIKNI